MFTEDLSTFFVEFGSDATLGGEPVRGVFDNAYALGNVGAVGMASEQPMFTVPTSSITGDPVGQSLVIGSQMYAVVEHRPDGTGISVLVLEVAA